MLSIPSHDYVFMILVSTFIGKTIITLEAAHSVNDTYHIIYGTDERTYTSSTVFALVYQDINLTKSLGMRFINSDSQLFPFCLWHAVQWSKQLAI